MFVPRFIIRLIFAIPDASDAILRFSQMAEPKADAITYVSTTNRIMGRILINRADSPKPVLRRSPIAISTSKTS
jgi:hypothetical protein